jgi:hypothetical protein
MSRGDRGPEGAAEEQPAAPAEPHRRRRGRRTAAEREADRARARAYRQRQAEGLVVTPVHYEADSMALAMVRLGYLRAADADDREAVAAAIQRHLDELARLSRHA